MDNSRQNSLNPMYPNLFGSGGNSLSGNPVQGQNLYSTQSSSVGQYGTAPLQQYQPMPSSLGQGAATSGDMLHNVQMMATNNQQIGTSGSGSYNYFKDQKDLFDAVNPFASPNASFAHTHQQVVQQQQQPLPQTPSLNAMVQQQSQQKPKLKKKTTIKQQSTLVTGQMGNLSINASNTASSHTPLSSQANQPTIQTSPLQHTGGRTSFQNLPPGGNQQSHPHPQMLAPSPLGNMAGRTSMGHASAGPIPGGQHPLGNMAGNASIGQASALPAQTGHIGLSPLGQAAGNNSMFNNATMMAPQQQHAQNQAQPNMQTQNSLASNYSNPFLTPQLNNPTGRNSNATMMAQQQQAQMQTQPNMQTQHSIQNNSQMQNIQWQNSIVMPPGTGAIPMQAAQNVGLPHTVSNVSGSQNYPQVGISGAQMESFFMGAGNQSQTNMMSYGSSANLMSTPSQKFIQYNHVAPMLPSDSFIAGGHGAMPQKEPKKKKKQSKPKNEIGGESMRMPLEITVSSSVKSKTGKTSTKSGGRHPLDLSSSQRRESMRTSSNASSSSARQPYNFVTPALEYNVSNASFASSSGRQPYNFAMPALEYNVSNVSASNASPSGRLPLNLGPNSQMLVPSNQGRNQLALPRKAKKTNKTNAIVPVQNAASFGDRGYIPSSELILKTKQKRRPEASAEEYIKFVKNAVNSLNKSDNVHFLTNGFSLVAKKAQQEQQEQQEQQKPQRYHIYPRNRLMIGGLMELLAGDTLKSDKEKEYMVLEKVHMMEVELNGGRLQLEPLGVTFVTGVQIYINLQTMEQQFASVWRDHSENPWDKEMKRMHRDFGSVNFFISDTDKEQMKTMTSAVTKFYNGYKGNYFSQLWVATSLSRISMLRITMHNSTRGQSGTDCTDLIELMITMSKEEREKLSLPSKEPAAASQAGTEDEFSEPYDGHERFEKPTESNFCTQLEKETELHYQGDNRAGRILQRIAGKNKKYNPFGYWIIHICKNRRSEELFDSSLEHMSEWVTELTDFLKDLNFTYKILELFTVYSYSRLRSIFDYYFNQTGKNVYTEIYQKWSEVRKNSTRDSTDHYIQLVNCIVEDVYMGRPYFFARLLSEKFEKLKDNTTSNDQDAFNDITRILITRAPIDLVEVNDEYLRMKGITPEAKTLEEGILKEIKQIINDYSTKRGSKDRGSDEVETLKGYQRIVKWALQNVQSMRKFVSNENGIQLEDSSNESDNDEQGYAQLEFQNGQGNIPMYGDIIMQQQQQYLLQQEQRQQHLQNHGQFPQQQQQYLGYYEQNDDDSEEEDEETEDEDESEEETQNQPHNLHPSQQNQMHPHPQNPQYIVHYSSPVRPPPGPSRPRRKNNY
ncbi:hypothetical protein niasHT_012246 [Heterodera trifolii]|uniref:Uncharacterized protein n=1 Tax=Heterodera trifolii TaxID=157864 RepID=A0ABD2KXV3_9BILA